MALRLLATIWSRGWRWGNCGSNSRQNSQGRLERGAEGRATAGGEGFTGGGRVAAGSCVLPFGWGSPRLFVVGFRKGGNTVACAPPPPWGGGGGPRARK